MDIYIALTFLSLGFVLGFTVFVVFYLLYLEFNQRKKKRVE